MTLKDVKSGLSKTKKETKIKLSPSEERDLISRYKQSRKITQQKFMTQMSKKKQKFPQPVRVQPTMEIFTNKDDDYTIAQRITKLSAKDVKKWGDKVIVDTKFDGIRAMIVVDPKTKDIRVLSRNLKTLKKFEKKYGSMIADNMSKLVKDKTVVDAELYALGSEGEILPGPTVTGWAKNPEAEKYSEIRPSIEVFDVMVLNSKDVREMPLKYRKRLLEMSLRKDDDRVMEFADTRLMSNNERLIYWLFNAKVNKSGFEGLVLKDPEAPMRYGKTGDMVKVKAIDTLDLRLKAVEAYPRGKVFKFYKHWIMQPEDASINIKCDKGIKSANMDENYYITFTKKLIKRWQKGEVEGEGGMVPISAKYKKIYGIAKIPKRLILKKGPIIEIFVEKMSNDLQPSGQKIVRIRDDKTEADVVEDLVRLRDYLLGVKR
jgi:ATP-dependent DNA ligase